MWREKTHYTYFDKLWLGEPDGCYETHSLFKGRLKRSLDHPFETVLGTVRHWRRADVADKQRPAKDDPNGANVLELTIIQGLEVSDNLDIFIHGRLLGVDGPSEHVATKLQLIFC